MDGIQEQLMLLVVMLVFLILSVNFAIYNLLLNSYFTFLLDAIHKFVSNTSLSLHLAGLICQGTELSLLDCEIVSRYCPSYLAGYVACTGKFV